jgi:predicted SprT family Zn-dependent metalloprotease
MLTPIGTIDTLCHSWNEKQRLEDGFQNNIYLQLAITCDSIKRTVCKIPVFTNTRFVSLSGRAKLWSKTIELHPGLLDQNDRLYFVKRVETFFHEIAHHVAYLSANDKGHGEAWRESIICFGYKPERCYSHFFANHSEYKHRKETRIVNEIADLLPELEF